MGDDSTFMPGLENSPELFEAILNYGLAYICVKDRAGRFVYVNDLDASLYNAMPAELIGKTTEPWVGPEICKKWLDHDLEVMNSGKVSHDGIYSRMGVDGQNHWFDTLRMPIRAKDRELLLILHRDVTQIKRTEEERDRLRQQVEANQKMEVLSLLAGSVAHDFNNLFTIISASTGLLLKENVSGDQKRFLVESIIESSERASELVTRLLVLGQKDAGAVLVLDLNQQILEAKPLIDSLLAERIRADFKLVPGGALIRGNISLIQHALMNLVLNARDAMPDGGNLILETTHAAEGERVVLRIRDTGTGMSVATREKAFEPFFTTKPVGQGSGLGLTVTRRIVEQHGGNIRMESLPGRGTSCIMDFPRVKPVTQELPVPVVSLKSKLNGKTVLLAEDEALLQTLISISLGSLGVKILTAENGDEAWRLFEQHRAEIDCVLSDVVMPGQTNGVSLRQKIARERPEIPAVLMSGYSFDFLKKDESLPNRTVFLSKPFTIEKLQQTIFDVMNVS